MFFGEWCGDFSSEVSSSHNENAERSRREKMSIDLDEGGSAIFGPWQHVNDGGV